MENILPIHLQEVVFSSSNSKLSKQISRFEKAGKLRHIAARIYSSNFIDSPETIVRRNLFAILGKLYPGSVISHRSALEFQPTSAGHIFITYTYTKKINLCGVTLRFMKGHGPIAGDNHLSGELYSSQPERAYLENLQVSRQPGPISKTLTLAEIEERLKNLFGVKGAAGLHEFSDKASVIAVKLGMEPGFENLKIIIKNLLAVHLSNVLSSPMAAAKIFGNPYDPSRLPLFEKLFIALKQEVFKDLPDKNTTEHSFRNFAFFEAYFSNYVGGTDFELEDVKKIIETETPITANDDHFHDVLGMYKLVSNRAEMNITPGTPEELLEILLARHKVLLGARAAKTPGQFKDKNNRVGEVKFVDRILVKGTLIKGFDFYRALNHPFSRAAFIMFLVSEVHPFVAGNGRIARIMMNAELVKNGQTKIMIPSVFRDDYMSALRRLSKHQDPTTYIQMLVRARQFSSTIVGDDMEAMEKRLEECNAFK